MAGTIKANQLTLGDSTTDTQNFAFRTNVDGTMKLARKSDGTGGDILTVDASGLVAMPQNMVAFGAYANTLTSLPTGVFTKVLFQVEDYDTAAAFDTAAGRFQPSVAGYYQFNASVLINTPAAELLCSIHKNGTEFIRGVMFGVADPGYGTHVAGLVYLNGSSDYVEIHAYHAAGSVRNTAVSTRALTAFQGILIAKA